MYIAELDCIFISFDFWYSYFCNNRRINEKFKKFSFFKKASSLDETQNSAETNS